MLPFLLLAVVAPAPSYTDACPRGAGGEVVICGSRPGESPYRVPRLPERYDPKQIRAEANVIPGVHARAHIDTETRPDGNQSNRVMVTLSTSF
jgi:hypothetical protein